MISSGVAPPSVVGAGMFMHTWVVVVGLPTSVVKEELVGLMILEVDCGANAWMELAERANESIAALNAFLLEIDMVITLISFGL